MSLTGWIVLVLLGMPLALIALTMWLSFRIGEGMNDHECSDSWGSQDVDIRIKD